MEHLYMYLTIAGGALFLTIHTTIAFSRWPNSRQVVQLPPSLLLKDKLPPKQFTPKYNYILFCSIYVMSYLIAYFAFVLFPNLIPQIQSMITSSQASTINVKDPAFIALVFLTSGMYAVPFLRRWDQLWRVNFHALAGMPDKATHVAAQCCEMDIFNPDLKILKSAVTSLCEETRLNPGIALSDTSETGDMFRRLAYVLDRLHALSVEGDRPHKYFTTWIDLDAVRAYAVNKLLTYTSQAKNQNKLFTTSKFKKTIQLQLLQVTQVMCCMMYTAYPSRQRHLDVFHKLGFYPNITTPPAIGINYIIITAVIVGLATMIAGSGYHYSNGLKGFELLEVLTLWVPLAVSFIAGTIFVVHITHYINSTFPTPMRGVAVWAVIGFMEGFLVGMGTFWLFAHTGTLSMEKLPTLYRWCLLPAINGGFIAMYPLIKIQSRNRVCFLALCQTVVSCLTGLLAATLYYSDKPLFHDPNLYWAVLAISAAMGLFTGYIICNYRRE